MNINENMFVGSVLFIHLSVLVHDLVFFIVYFFCRHLICRLNVFGYLSLNSSAVPGNNGLRDIITLLKWVRRNAQAFGGDPDDVTLAGQSCGSAAAHLVSLSKVSVGLFKRYGLTLTDMFRSIGEIYI